MRRLAAGMRTPSVVLTGVVALSVLAAALLALVVTRGDDSNHPSSTPLPARTTHIDARSFLDTYVRDGRVVRLDQGGDTVSEGQAYGMLIAVGAHDEQAFRAIWQWSEQHLQRPDGLLSWRWQDGKVADPSSAADADLDAARALVRGGAVFHDATYEAAGVRLGKAILDHETVSIPQGRLLVAGQWATGAPYWFDPSYFSPVAVAVLGKASGDPRWAELDRGSVATMRSLTDGGQLPPDWARVDQDGTARAVNGPGGQPVQYGYDAARTVPRMAESCRASDRAWAADTARIVAHDGQAPVATYDLSGSPQTSSASPLMSVSQAAGLAAARSGSQAVAEIRRAGTQQQQSPTYYGDAWTVLGPMLLSQRDLGGCPPLGASS